MIRAFRGASSFRRKVALSVILTAGLSIVTVSTVLVVADYANTQRETVESVQSQAAMVALDSGPALLFGDAVHGTEVLATLRAAPDVASAELFDREGRPFASYARDVDPGPAPGVTRAASPETGRWRVLSLPVVDRGELQGELALVYDFERVRARSWRNAFIALLVAAAAMFLAYLQARRISDGLTVQIDELVRTATRVGETGDFAHRAAHLSNDELGDLALAFNRMLAQIEQQRADLLAAQAARDELLASERAARAEAERASRLKDEFVATLSHELRTPLTPILGWVSILEKVGPADDTTRQALEVIGRSVRLQLRMIEDLLDMSRITSGKLHLDVQNLDLRQIVEAALATVRHAAEAREIRLESDLGDSGVVLQGDPARLQQVIWNLLSNAIKFTDVGGRVGVRLAGHERQVEITVSDSGQGIAPDLLPYVFDRFRQGDSSTTRRHGGLGLGLAIARQLTELHGGALSAKSDGLGTGSSFTVTLPRAAQALRPAPPPPSEIEPVPVTPKGSAPSPRFGGIELLVVDDDVDVRHLLRRLLESAGASVRVAASMDEALASLEKQPADLLISDIGMPGADGYELLRRLRGSESERLRRLPAIALTAFARPDDRARSLRAGYQLHVSKPVEVEELFGAIAQLVETPLNGTARPGTDAAGPAPVR